MARRSRQGVLKRQRERKKAEKAALKRELRSQRDKPEGSNGAVVASQDDLAAYGLVTDPEADESQA